MKRQFGDLTATELYCPQCGRAQPVRERVLLVLPEGQLHDFVCTRCGSSLGTRTTHEPSRFVAHGPEGRLDLNS
ncbi:MAG: hypothetical protein RMN51_09255 [Verrucomicrobiota bacterium]|nr:hypothetical protein [Limisphaera sp.]MDW8382278.1 hypothetical protein [Verrucomicrobiota bacterium]